MLQGRCCRQSTPETQIPAAVLKGPERHMLVLSLGLSDVWVSTPSCSGQAQKGCCISMATDHVNTAQELYDGRWDRPVAKSTRFGVRLPVFKSQLHHCLVIFGVQGRLLKCLVLQSPHL